MDAAAKKHLASTITNVALLFTFGLFIVSYVLKEFSLENVPQPQTNTVYVLRPAPVSPAVKLAAERKFADATTPTNALSPNVTPAAEIIMPTLGQDLTATTTSNNATAQKIALTAPTLEQELRQAPDNSATAEDITDTSKGNNSDEDTINLSTMSKHPFGQHAFENDRFSASFIKQGLWGSNE
ncbi:MAG TPA: hypothetical protein VGV92_09745 [Gammaproteobacteria bacterium]|nr:hypothetical protein [Gammaproteobacteria bacterium]